MLPKFDDSPSKCDESSHTGGLNAMIMLGRAVIECALLPEPAESTYHVSFLMTKQLASVAIPHCLQEASGVPHSAPALECKEMTAECTCMTTTAGEQVNCR